MSSDPLNFPDVLVGANTNASTILSATGGTNVTLIAVLHGGADCSQFSIVSPINSFTVDGSKPQTVVVKFSPTSPGNKTCTITLGASLVGVLPTASKGQFTGSDRPEVRLLALGAFTPAVLDARLVLSINAGPVLRGHADVGLRATTESCSAPALGGTKACLIGAIAIS